MLPLGFPKDFKRKFFFCDCVPFTSLTFSANFIQGHRADVDYVVFDLVQVKPNLENRKN